jgi:hypothetical protein
MTLINGENFSRRCQKGKKKFLNDVFVVTFDEGFVVLHIQVQALKTLFPTDWYPYG